MKITTWEVLPNGQIVPSDGRQLSDEENAIFDEALSKVGRVVHEGEIVPTEPEDLTMTKPSPLDPLGDGSYRGPDEPLREPEPNNHMPDAKSESEAPMLAFGKWTLAQLDEARRIAVEVMKTYGDLTGDEYERFLENPWDDHCAVQAALRAMPPSQGRKD
jgi:hypothetical protein